MAARTWVAILARKLDNLPIPNLPTCSILGSYATHPTLADDLKP
jgi:hypothetical protein